MVKHRSIEALATALDLHLNWEQLHQLADDSPEFELELLQIFAEDSQAHLDQLRQAIASGHCGQAEEIAHYIKGASANIGAIAMEMVAARLEQQARRQQMEESDRLLQELEIALAQIQHFVEQVTQS